MFCHRSGLNFIRSYCKSGNLVLSRTSEKSSLIRCATRSTYSMDSIQVCAYHNTTRNKSLSNVRTYSKDIADKPDIEDEHEPVRYSTSKARQWNVSRSFGSDRKPYPVWVVATISLTLFGILTWAFFRKETELDELLGKDLHEQLAKINPNLKVAEPGKDTRIAR